MTRSLTREEAKREIAALRTELDDALDEVERLRKADVLSPTHLGYLNDYAAVRMAGYLEQLCFHSISGAIGEVSSGSSQQFINSWFYKSPNLTAEQFRSLFRRFGPEIDQKVFRFLQDDLHLEILNNLLEVRNSIAHGKEYGQSGRQNLATFRQLVSDVSDLVDDLLLGPDPII